MNASPRAADRPERTSLRIEAGPDGNVTITEDRGLTSAQLRQAAEMLADRAEAAATQWFGEFVRSHGLDVLVSRVRDGTVHAHIVNAEHKESQHHRALRTPRGSSATQQAAVWTSSNVSAEASL